MHASCEQIVRNDTQGWPDRSPNLTSRKSHGVDEISALALHHPRSTTHAASLHPESTIHTSRHPLSFEDDLHTHKTAKYPTTPATSTDSSIRHIPRARHLSPTIRPLLSPFPSPDALSQWLCSTSATSPLLPVQQATLPTKKPLPLNILGSRNKLRQPDRQITH